MDANGFSGGIWKRYMLTAISDDCFESNLAQW